MSTCSSTASPKCGARRCRTFPMRRKGQKAATSSICRKEAPMSPAVELSRFRPLVAALVGGSLLAACSDIYYDRRDTVSFQAGDAVAANKVVHAVDMWPQAAGYRDIESNGQKMQSAVERYRTNK